MIFQNDLETLLGVESGYEQELSECVHANEAFFRRFDGRSFLVSGAAGLIGSYLIDLLIQAHRELGIVVRVFACDRNGDLLKRRFPDVFTDVVQRCVLDICTGTLPAERVDYIIHAASNTSPKDYATRPIDTIRTNMQGLDRLCEFAVSHKVRRFLQCSSVEVYGRNNGDTDFFAEDYSGYVDCNTVRACYPSAKRCAETLCNAYATEHPEFNFVIARIGRIYGPTALLSDSKAMTQFLLNAARGEDIVLKSDGTQLYSWCYVADCAMALLTLLLDGLFGEAYNVADPESCCTLREFAETVASAVGRKVVFCSMTSAEHAAYSTISKATLNVEKLSALGWRAYTSLADGVRKTIEQLYKSLNVNSTSEKHTKAK